MTTLVLSPHYDDAVLSCGHWLASNPGAIVATVCGGLADPKLPAGSWAQLAGFTSANQETVARRSEDVQALEVLRCVQGPALDFLDAQNRRRGETLEDLELAIEELLVQVLPERCLIPLGVAHADHIATGSAARRVLRGHPGVEAIVYADLPQRVLNPTAFVASFARCLRREQLQLVEDVQWNPPESDQPKRVAFARYTSQVPLLDPQAIEQSMGTGAERFWRMAR
jgi:LmbE family N-acetylglucosaminyl deacetylase